MALPEEPLITRAEYLEALTMQAKRRGRDPKRVVPEQDGMCVYCTVNPRRKDGRDCFRCRNYKARNGRYPPPDVIAKDLARRWRDPDGKKSTTKRHRSEEIPVPIESIDALLTSDPDRWTSLGEYARNQNRL